MKQILNHKKAQYLFLIIFLLALFTFRIPNFYILPGLQSPFFTFQAVGRILLILVFTYNVTRSFFNKKNILQQKEHTIIISLVMLLFTIQSLSVIEAQNISSFLSRYKDVFIGLVAFFDFYFYRGQYKKIVLVFLIALPLNYIYQLIMVWVPQFFNNIFSIIIYDRHFEVVEINLARGRTYIETYDEIALPIVFVYFSDKFRYISIFTLIMALFSFISNWRTHVIMFSFSLINSFIFLMRQRTTFKRILFLLVTLSIVTSITDRYLLSTYGHSFYDRILLTNQSDRLTVTSRFDQIGYGLEMAKSSITGVGLGNYYDNLSFDNKVSNRTQTLAERQQQIANEYVHNYFGLLAAESGFISLFVFIILIIFFVMKDVQVMKGRNSYLKAFVISFWSLFIYAMLNPLVPGSSQVLFWGIRGILLIDQEVDSRGN